MARRRSRERRDGSFLGGRRSRAWAYLFLLVVVVAGVAIFNFFVLNPAQEKDGVVTIAGVPAWAFPLLAIAIGGLLFWFGLKVRSDLPELVGATVIAGGVAAAQIMIGWSKLELGGIVVIPYAIPALAFLILMLVAASRSR